MSESIRKIDFSEWVSKAGSDKVKYLQRQASEIVLHAIAMHPELSQELYLKGGILLNLVYESMRQTNDIDFSLTPSIKPDELPDSEFERLLNSTLNRAAMKHGYSDLALLVQSVRRFPRKSTDSFPTVRIKVGYAERGSNQETRLKKGEASNTVRLDISFNEIMEGIQVLEIADEEFLFAYSREHVIAEKYRALLQQPIRNRFRRQDVYDLYVLTKDMEESDENNALILSILKKKCLSRGITPNVDSIIDPRVRTNASEDWDALELELGELPQFNFCFEQVSSFYRRLPWPHVKEAGKRNTPD